MAASQPFGVSCKGGLNTNLNQLEMLAQPGLATKLQNFEVNPDGGYRRINGFTAFGSTRPNGSNPNLGIQVYADGVVVCSGTPIYFLVLMAIAGYKLIGLVFTATETIILRLLDEAF